jgi:Tol biopolymer transport system component
MWSPDGSRFVVEVNYGRGPSGLVMVSVVDGEPGAVVPIDPLPSSRRERFAPDGSWIYFEHGEGDTRALVRVALTDDGWDDWQVVATDDVRDIEDLDADGSTLLYSVRSGPTMLAVDVSGAVPAAPVELGGPLPANIWNETGQLTPDGRFALLQQEVGDFGPYRLVLVDLAAPETSEEIMADVRIAQVVPSGP